MRVRTLRGSWRVVMEARAGRAGRPGISPLLQRDTSVARQGARRREGDSAGPRNGTREGRRGRGEWRTGNIAGCQAAHRSEGRGGVSREARRPSIAPYRNRTRGGRTSTRHDDVARRRGRGEGRATGRGPIEAKRWGSEKGVGKYDG